MEKKNKTVNAIANGKLITAPGAVPDVSIDLNTPIKPNLTRYSNAANR